MTMSSNLRAAQPEFAFAIPFRSKVVAKSWDEVLARFRTTLRSILQQTSPHWRLFVACHDVPDVPEMADPRIEIVAADYEPPIYHWEYLVDKAKKRELAAQRLRHYGGGFVMFTDDDDLISNRLVEWVRTQPSDSHGFVMPKGYEYYTLVDRLRYAPRYHKMGGTCAVLRLTIDDIPEVPLQRGRSFLRDIVETSHAEWDELFARKGRPLAEVPFPAGIWVRHEDQLSGKLGIRGWRRELIRLVHPARTPRPTQRAEFGIPEPARKSQT